MGVRLDHKDIVFDVKTLCNVLGLPAEGTRNLKKFTPLPSLSKIVRHLRELEYDESQVTLNKISTVDRKFIPQPGSHFTQYLPIV